MLKQEYEPEDLGMSSTVSTLGEIMTDPGFKPGEWFIKHADEDGIYIIPLEEELMDLPGNHRGWETPAKAIFNDTQMVVIVIPVKNPQREKHITTLLHRKVVGAYYTKIEEM